MVVISVVCEMIMLLFLVRVGASHITSDSGWVQAAAR